MSAGELLFRRLFRHPRRLGGYVGGDAAPAGTGSSPLQARAQACVQGVPTAAPWAPTHRHRKGGLYRVLAHGTLESDRSAVVIYDDPDGAIWIRPEAEFCDGRFRRCTGRPA